MKKLRLLFRYIQYISRAKSIHAAHSPFLYNFFVHVLKNTPKDENCKAIENLRKTLCKNETEISITDFGAGSNINRNPIRKIKDIAKNSAKNTKFGTLLYQICAYFQPTTIVELGTSLGISTCYLAKSHPDSKVFTFEGCPQTASIAQDNFRQLSLQNVEITIGDFQQTLSEKLIELQNVELAFIDGNHQEKPTISYFETLLTHSAANAIFIFDDIHWSEGMEKAWNHIKIHPKTTLTIDLFFVGIVFLNPKLSKENFVIRF